MNDQLTEYLSAVGAPEVLVTRVAYLVQTYADLLPEDVGAWFVSEYRDDDDQRTFESLWLFSENFAMEARLLGAEEDHFDFVPFKSTIRHLVVDKRSFNLSEATAVSRMTVEIWFGDRRYGVMRATGENCVPLVEVLKTILLPNAMAV